MKRIRRRAMEKSATAEKQGSFLLAGIVGIGAAIGVWAVMTLIFSLAKVNWQLSELVRQYLVSVGAIHEYETLVDFYTHIKGVEYIICVAFLGAFPAFFKYISRTKAPIASK